MIRYRFVFIHFLFCLLWISYPLISGAQVNIVPNAGFEEFIRCPLSDNYSATVKGIENYCPYWEYPVAFDEGRINVNQYLNKCSKDPMPFSCSVPNNIFGYQEAFEGDGYAQISMLNDNALDNRNFLSVKLTTNLVKGKKYYASFRISPADSNIWFSNKFGIKFFKNRTLLNSSDSISKNVYPNSADIYSDSVIDDVNRWYCISGVFKADADYSYLIIGNFWNKSQLSFRKSSRTSHFYVAKSAYYIDAVEVKEIPKKIVCTKTRVCIGDSVILETLNMDTTFYWSTQLNGSDTIDKNKNISVSPLIPTTYYLFEAPNILVDSFHVITVNSSKNLPTDTMICEESSIAIGPIIEAESYKWSTGENAKIKSINKEGTYTLTSIWSNCIQTDTITVNACDYYMYIPNSFTPNGDGLNDYFEVFASRIKTFELQIYDRWGKQLYQFNRTDDKWNGEDKQEPLPGGVYFYNATYTRPDNGSPIFKKGTITLLR